LQTPNLEEGEAVGGGDGTVRKSVGEFLQAVRSNFSSIFTRYRDTAACVLQHATFSLDTPLLFGLKFRGVPFGVDP